MARKNEVDVKQREKVGMRLIPYYGIEFDHHRLSGHTAVGRTPEKVMANARRAIRHMFPADRYEVEVYALNPETFERAGVVL